MDPQATHEVGAQRAVREAAFHDDCFAHNKRAGTDRFYRIARASEGHYKSEILRGVVGQRVLEYGCGTGSSAFLIAQQGGTVVGIDISPTAISKAQEHASLLGLHERLDFRVMNAEALALEAGSIDLVCGTGILHHLDLAKALPEIARVLRPRGRAVFLEPLAHNPLINLYRTLTPHLRTADEHPLTRQDLEAGRSLFADWRQDHYHLATLGVVPLVESRLLGPLLATAERVDRILLQERSPLRYWAWQVVIRATARG